MDNKSIIAIVALLIACVAIITSVAAGVIMNDIRQDVDDTISDIEDILDKFDIQDSINEDQEYFNRDVADYITLNTEMWNIQVEYNEVNTAMWDNLLTYLGIQ